MRLIDRIIGIFYQLI